MKAQFVCLLFIWISISFAVAQDSIPVADCDPPKSSTYLDINNVWAMIHSGGDMWWDLHGDPEYEIPAGSGKNSAFADALTVGALDRQHCAYHGSAFSPIWYYLLPGTCSYNW